MQMPSLLVYFVYFVQSQVRFVMLTVGQSDTGKCLRLKSVACPNPSCTAGRVLRSNASTTPTTWGSVFHAEAWKQQKQLPFPPPRLVPRPCIVPFLCTSVCARIPVSWG